MFTNVLTYMMMVSKNETWKAAEKKNDVKLTADALAEHMYYDGDSIPLNQMVSHYNRSGKLMGIEELSMVLREDKVVMLLSPNCCSSCATGEINKLLEIAKEIGREHLVMVVDFALHKESSWSMCFDKEGFYETDVEHLGLAGSLTRETPVVMLTQNGRIKTSFIVGQQTSEFAGRFHEYLIEYFKRKK